MAILTDMLLMVVSMLLPVLSLVIWLKCKREYQHSKLIRGKRVLVTGASSGIGEKVAYKYAELGARLVIVARRMQLLEKVAERCKDLGANSVDIFSADLALTSDRQAMVDFTLEKFNGLDILILNHAVLSEFRLWKSVTSDWEFLEKVMLVNFSSYVDISSKFLNALEESKGSIGVVSSGAGKFGFNGFTQYCASKHALQGYYAALRQELRYRKADVSITLIVFGGVDSEHAIEISKTVPSTMSFLDSAGSTIKAAEALVKGVTAKNYEVHYPFYLNVVMTLNKFNPKFAENFLNSFFDIKYSK